MAGVCWLIMVIYGSSGNVGDIGDNGNKYCSNY